MQHSNLDLRKIMVGHPSNPAEQEAYQRFSRYIWYVVIVMVGCTLASYAYLGISVNLEGAWWFPSVPPFFVGMAFFYGRIRPDQYLSRLMETTAQLFLFYRLRLCLHLPPVTPAGQFRCETPGCMLLICISVSIGLVTHGFLMKSQ